MSSSLAYRVLFVIPSALPVIPSALPVIPSAVEESLHHCPEGRALRPFIWGRGGAGSSSAPTLNAVPVTIGESVLNIQAGSKAHIVGDKSPMYGVLNEVEMGKSPDISMNHLAAVVALKIANNTDGSIDINEIVFKTQGVPLVGNFIADLTKINDEGKIQSPFREEEDKFNNNGTKEEVISPFKSNGNNPTSVTISCPGTQIQANGFETFYFAVCPNVHKINTFTILINGSEKVPQAVEDVVFEPGKVTTLRLNIDKPEVNRREGAVYDALNLEWTDKITGKTAKIVSIYDSKIADRDQNGNITKTYAPLDGYNSTATINNVENVPVYVIGNNGIASIKIEGSLKEMVEALPLGFYASRWNNLPTAMKLSRIDVLLAKDYTGDKKSQLKTRQTLNDKFGLAVAGLWFMLKLMGKDTSALDDLNFSDGISYDEIKSFGISVSAFTFSGMITNMGFGTPSNVLMIDEERTNKTMSPEPGGNVENYLQKAGETATFEGLKDILTIRYNDDGTVTWTDEAEATAAAIYAKLQSFVTSMIKSKMNLGDERNQKVAKALLEGMLGDEEDLMYQMRDMVVTIEVETCPYPEETDYNPIVFWGFNCTPPTTTSNH